MTWSDEWDGRRFQLELFRGSLLAVGKEGNDFIGLSELGSLITLKLNHETWRLVSKKQLFFANSYFEMFALLEQLAAAPVTSSGCVGGSACDWNHGAPAVAAVSFGALRLNEL